MHDAENHFSSSVTLSVAIEEKINILKKVIGLFCGCGSGHLSEKGSDLDSDYETLDTFSNFVEV